MNARSIAIAKALRIAAVALLMLSPLSVVAAEPDPWVGVDDTSMAARFLAADAARDTKDHALAERRYRALIAQTQGELRVEARFRLALMLDALGKQREAATELRAVLDEKPDAQGIRVILARMLAQSGDADAARKEFREAEAAGLPPEVQAVVRQFVAALRTSKPFGGQFGLSFVADSNINRATSSDSIDTIIAPFQLSEDAQAQSGAGAAVSGQLFARARISDRVKLLGRVTGQGDFYNKSTFNDVRGGGQIGLEWQSARDRIAPSIGRSYRWFGGDRYATTSTASLGWRHRAGAKSLIDSSISYGKANYALNDALDGPVYDLSIRYERALSAKHGASIGISAQRQDARDAGYATTSAGLEGLYWRQAGQMTLYGVASAQRLKADERLALFPENRKDWYFSASLGASASQRPIAGFTPVLRATYSRNSSTVTLYDYSRVRFEFGLTRNF